MTTSPPEATSPLLVPRVALRLRLGQGVQSGPVDGAWWPQSRNLQAEVADLVDHFPHLVGQIERLLFSRPDWDKVAGTGMHRIQAARGVVKVGSFPSDDTHVVVVKMSSGSRLRLLVVPPDTEPTPAARMMEQAADDLNVMAPGEILGVTGPDQSGIGFDIWDDDGSLH